MSRRDATDSESLSTAVKLDNTLRRAMRSALQKRLAQFSPVSDANSKRRRICSQTSYKSPLIHLKKPKNTCSTSLDDSVIILEELETLTTTKNPRVCNGEKKRPVSPDDSVIILSDNEGESRTEENIETKSPKKVHSKSNPHSPIKLSSELATIELRPISIDSEDENTTPNNDSGSSMSKPYVEIVLVDNSPATRTAKNISPSAILSSGIKGRGANAKASSRLTELPTRPMSTDVNFSPQGIRTAAEQLISLSSVKMNTKPRKTPFLIDTKGDPSNLDCMKSKGRSEQDKRQARQKGLQNPNWATFVRNMRSESLSSMEPTAQVDPPKLHKIGSNCAQGKDVSSTSSHTKEQTAPTNQPVVGEMGNYYTVAAVDKEPGSLREIVIDGCNVAMAYTNGRFFSEDGLKLVINYFQLRGHTVRVFVPQHQRSAAREFLEHLYTKGIAAFTPSRKIGGKKIVSYDDRFILDYATMCDGIVVSRDQYRDLYKEKEQWKNIIENRLLMPTFVGNCVMFPEDPLGRFGPTLEQFLRH